MVYKVAVETAAWSWVVGRGWGRGRTRTRPAFSWMWGGDLGLGCRFETIGIPIRSWLPQPEPMSCSLTDGMALRGVAWRGESTGSSWRLHPIYYCSPSAGGVERRRAGSEVHRGRPCRNILRHEIVIIFRGPGKIRMLQRGGGRELLKQPATPSCWEATGGLAVSESFF